jgi:hypothetical protein
MRTPPGAYASFAAHQAAWPDERDGAVGAQPRHPGDEETLRALERAMQEFDVSSGPPPQVHSSWNFTSMPADSALMQPDDDPITEDDIEHQNELAARLTRTLQHRPLMSRLSRIEAAYAELPTSITPPEPPVVASVPPPLPPVAQFPKPAEQAQHVAPGRPIEELMEEYGDEQEPLPESSTAWLGNARRERSRVQLHNVAAWFATLAIGFSVIGIAILMLQV